MKLYNLALISVTHLHPVLYSQRSYSTIEITSTHCYGKALLPQVFSSSLFVAARLLLDYVLVCFDSNKYVNFIYFNFTIQLIGDEDYTATKYRYDIL